MPLQKKTATELGFKVGDLFTYVGGRMDELRHGDTVKLYQDDGTKHPYFTNESKGLDYQVCVSFDELEVLNKTLATLSVGDILSHTSWGTPSQCMILVVLAPGIYLLSEDDEFNVAGGLMTTKELEDGGYTIKQDISAGTREITMAEVVDKFGENVVIKKED
jgi:hypothetical protein